MGNSKTIPPAFKPKDHEGWVRKHELDEMPESLMKQFGYAPLTGEVKAKIFGLDAARLYGVDPKAKPNPMPPDYVDRLRKQYRETVPAASNPQYGWVRA